MLSPKKLRTNLVLRYENTLIITSYKLLKKTHHYQTNHYKL